MNFGVQDYGFHCDKNISHQRYCVKCGICYDWVVIRILGGDGQLPVECESRKETLTEDRMINLRPQYVSHFNTKSGLKSPKRGTERRKQTSKRTNLLWHPSHTHTLEGNKIGKKNHKHQFDGFISVNFLILLCFSNIDLDECFPKSRTPF